MASGNKPPQQYLCSECGRKFESDRARSQHESASHKQEILQCVPCGRKFASTAAFMQHQEASHSSKNVKQGANDRSVAQGQQVKHTRAESTKTSAESTKTSAEPKKTSIEPKKTSTEPKKTIVESHERTQRTKAQNTQQPKASAESKRNQPTKDRTQASAESKRNQPTKDRAQSTKAPSRPSNRNERAVASSDKRTQTQQPGEALGQWTGNPYACPAYAYPSPSNDSPQVSYVSPYAPAAASSQVTYVSPYAPAAASSHVTYVSPYAPAAASSDFTYVSPYAPQDHSTYSSSYESPQSPSVSASDVGTAVAVGVGVAALIGGIAALSHWVGSGSEASGDNENPTPRSGNRHH